jgi:Holliday junction resolvase
MSEQKLQTKILRWLKERGFWAIKIVVSSVTGTMDIIACSPKGKFVGIEVKYGANKPSPLQSYHIQEVQKRGGLAFVAWDLETVIYKLSGEVINEQSKKEKPKGAYLL